MKITKGFAFFLVVTIFIICGSCVNEPHFSSTPEIAIDDYYFIVTPKAEDADTLFLVLKFKDGDGDLGLPSNGYLDEPYNNINFFLENGGPAQELGTSTYTNNNGAEISPIINVPNNAVGTLVTINTKDKPAYDTLPSYEFPYTRTKYYYGKVYVREGDKGIFENATPPITPVDTVTGDGQTYYALLETFYFEPNPNYSNIDVTFETRINNQFEPFDWTKTDAVISPFNDRFPVLSEDTRPTEGTLKYAMSYTGYLDDFNISNTVIRLKIQIKDRALHKSNIVYTGDFTLAKIKRN